ncbi:Piso0_001346 [Millerozyma farinosa CBS 7064]|uniref:Piso0_001346 protein n=1 Tax=Pichia sorbitophila (strain ATCC MYA-4447 / BCRC 22081 / CBS 7064 / NBRC 10061 / NRRL Y-12695) TaxID=559304 RepID=G8YMI1_PICSO|nr:Piso0_001346 [Millerozyma farinosa CBS 7064]
MKSQSFRSTTRKKRKHSRRRDNERYLRPDDFQAYGRIGSGQDLFDDKKIHNSYSWKYLLPIADNPIDETKRVNCMKTLKSICYDTIAKNVRQLDNSLLGQLSWKFWREVWNRLLICHQDSPVVFNLFASNFSSEAEFSSHLLPSDHGSEPPLNSNDLVYLRNQSLSATLVPGRGNHRLENFFSGIHISDLVTYCHKLTYNPWVLLDLSHSLDNYSSDNLIQIFNFPNLLALDLSGSNSIDDHYLYKMAISMMTEEKLPNLLFLKIDNCPNITKEGLEKFLRLTEECELFCIESNIALRKENYMEKFSSMGAQAQQHVTIPGYNWVILPQNSLSVILSRLPLALKLHCIFKNLHSAFNRSIGANASDNFSSSSPFFKKRIVLDIIIHGYHYDENNAVACLKAAYKRRMSLRSSSANNRVFYVKQGAMEGSTTGTSASKLSSQGKKRAGTSESEHTRKRMKPKGKLANVKDFFSS